MRQDERAPFIEALERARLSAYAPGEFVGQESFMRAGEILTLARQAGIGPGVTVLDLCCGVAGPGRLVTRELGCTYLGLDYSDSAVAIARELAAGLDCRFEAAQVPPVPAGPFDVIMLLETILAFEDKRSLVLDIAGSLAPGGRFAFTLEEGLPMTASEQLTMPDADTVWLTPLADMHGLLADAGLHVTWEEECTSAHLDMVDSLIAAFEADADEITEQVGQQALDELIAAHRLWSDWMRSGRVRKFAMVAELPLGTE